MSETLPPRFLSGKYPHNEKGRCHWCGGPVKPPRRTWCSQDCVDEWTIRTSPEAVRHIVGKRDHGICHECGTDTTAEARRRYDGIRPGLTWQSWYVKYAPWEADHIVPVWKGGGLAGADGYQTLCRDCHRRKTAREAAERAAQRRPEPVDPFPGQLAMTDDD